MDMMMLRRGLLMGMTNTAGVGGLTKYAKLSVTPINTSELNISNPIGVVPKLISIVAPADSEPYTARGYIQYVEGGDLVLGMCGVNLSSGNLTLIGVVHAANISGGNNEYYWDATQIQVRRYSNNVQWSTNTAYDVEIWG